jgi:hypothetical protein
MYNYTTYCMQRRFGLISGKDNRSTYYALEITIRLSPVQLSTFPALAWVEISVMGASTGHKELTI